MNMIFDSPRMMIQLVSVITLAMVAGPTSVTLGPADPNPDPGHLMAAVHDGTTGTIASPEPLCEAADASEQEPCERFRWLREINPEAYAEEREECECILIAACRFSRASVDYIMEVTDAGDVVRHVSITTCHYDGCDASYELPEVPVE